MPWNPIKDPWRLNILGYSCYFSLKNFFLNNLFWIYYFKKKHTGKQSLICKLQWVMPHIMGLRWGLGPVLFVSKLLDEGNWTCLSFLKTFHLRLYQVGEGECKLLTLWGVTQLGLLGSCESWVSELLGCEWALSCLGRKPCLVSGWQSVP